MSPNDLLALLIALIVGVVAVSWVAARYLTTTRPARAELTAATQYRSLAEEYRRLSDMAITAHEHVDLRLTDLSVRLDELKDQMEQMQRILKEVE
jgi:uncharacterized protein HemX